MTSSQPVPPRRAAPPSALLRARPARVLAADDDPSIREMTREALEALGFVVTDAASGEEALAAFDRHAPDLVLLDVHMGKGIDGFETCTALRSRPAGRTVPIVMLTGDEDAETIQRAYDCGATDFERKGVSPLVLGKRLRFLFRSKEVLDELRDSELRLEAAQELARVGSFEWDERTNTHVWSREMFRLLGLDPAVTRPEHELFLRAVHAEDRPRVEGAMRDALRSRERYELEYRLDRGGRTLSIVQHRGEPILDDGLAIGVCGTVQDITEVRQAEDRIRHLVYYDTLTGLPNRALFFERAATALAGAERRRTHAAVIFLDLDGFKHVNDTFGHATGDRLLEQVAERLRAAVRTGDTVSRFDSGDDPTLCRLGGDEFVVLLNDVRRDEDVGSVAWRLVQSLRTAFDLSGHEIFVTGSAGAAVYPKDGADAGTLLKHADAAMYAAKDRGRDQVSLYDSGLNAKVTHRLTVENGLRHALRRDELELHYQPIVDAATGRVVAGECLVRWNHPERGLVFPGEFIPVAEDSGLIAPLSEWVMRAACEQQCRWASQGLAMQLSFNVSSRHFELAEVADRLEEIAREAGADTAGLTVEVTESLFLRDTEKTQRTLRKLKALGLSIALDDFGTGYSALSYLRQFPVDHVKVDRVFVQDLEESAGAVALVEAIALLSRRLGIEPLAEGVETERQREILRATGYRRMQGFLFARAVPAPQFAALLRAPAR